MHEVLRKFLVGDEEGAPSTGADEPLPAVLAALDQPPATIDALEAVRSLRIRRACRFIEMARPHGRVEGFPIGHRLAIQVHAHDPDEERGGEQAVEQGVGSLEEVVIVGPGSGLCPDERHLIPVNLDPEQAVMRHAARVQRVKVRLQARSALPALAERLPRERVEVLQRHAERPDPSQATT